MGRWGYGIYDSDSSLDFLDTLTETLMKDMSYLLAPEQIRSNTGWLRDVLTLVEMMLILAEQDHDTYLMDQHEAVRRWRDVFFGVWDADWDDPREDISAYGTYASRVEHRHTVVILFDRLIEMADHWQKQTLRCDVPPFVLAEQLPLLSISRLKTRDGRDYFLVGAALYDFIDLLISKIVFIFSDENREKEWGLDFDEMEKIWVCVDLIGLFCESYQVPPGLRLTTIQRWLDTMMGLWIRYYSGDSEDTMDVQTLAEKDEMYPYVMTAFIRLMTAAQRQPRGWDDL